jgi:hypothetical protein
MMRDIKFDTISGIIEDIGLTRTSLHFSEWWGREGMDINLYNEIDDDARTISLSRDELHAIAVAAISCNYIDFESVKIESESIIEESKKRKEELNKKYMDAAMGDSITGLGNLNALSNL